MLHSVPVLTDRGLECTGSMFNRGKVLAAMGDEAKAQDSYRLALKLAEGVASATWTKCFAAIKVHTDAELQAMEDAAGAFVSVQGGYRYEMTIFCQAITTMPLN